MTSSQKKPFHLLGIALVIVFSLVLAFFSSKDHRFSIASLYSRHFRGEDSKILTSNKVLTSELASINNASLLKRDDYSCSKDKPCRNGACCGASGFCGYGPTYCGSGCVSNCDATAECGQYAKVPGTKCPLNTCQYGFCGTTELFCDSKCQSNCVLHPSPPGGGSGLPITQSRVIGYYESWSARKSCHKIEPTNLPLDALTHVNFAFAYIAPGSYEIVTMDSETPSDLFKQTANLKAVKPDIFVYVSVGGWTFSDNDTATQPLFGEIAADAGKRQKFADNALHFMRQYGFDGMDLDWEYPGAPDRGGKTEDTKNFVKLMQTLRETFDASGSHLGLTFTAPSSYWYLRWFDMPGLLKFADWVNFMTYDLHGVWDSTNPIGSIVQGHTNLTEIKLATELLWRVEVPPGKVVLGVGFYGRSFTLQNPSCNTPGCPFRGASKPGPCSQAGGILAYYEIMEILKKASSSFQATQAGGGFKPTHDTTAAVKYFTFDNDQWISYDDDETFKQKVQWANGIGLGGSLIWASDLDDDKYSAHAGFLGRSVASTASIVKKLRSNPTSLSLVKDLAGSNGQNCFAYTKKCVDLNDNRAMQAACGSGFTVVGWDDAGCGKKSCHCGKPICCPTNEAPKGCIWRGNDNGRGISSDCNAQCFPGETNIKGISSSWGGGFVNDGNTNKCGRSYKVFCCPNPDAGQVTKGCKYAGCRSDCPKGTSSIFERVSECFIGSQQYCCPDPVGVTGCHWKGGSKGLECVNPICNETEIEMDRDQFGDSNIGGCSWGRKKVACCTVQLAPPPPSTCSANICNLGLCNSDIEPRSLMSARNMISKDQSPNPYHHVNILQKRKDRIYQVLLPNGYLLILIAAHYPTMRDIYESSNASQVIRTLFRLISGWCIGPAISTQTIGPGKNPPGLQGLETEHPLDLQIMARFIEAASTGLLRNRYRQALSAVPSDLLQLYWDHPFPALGRRPAVGGPNGLAPAQPSERMTEAFGSDHYLYPFLPTDVQINGPKGKIMNLNAPVDIRNIGTMARNAVRLDTQRAADDLLSEVRLMFAVFEYMNTNDFAIRLNAVIDQVRLQLGYIERDAGIPRLAAWWDLFIEDFLTQVEQFAQNWAEDAINAAGAPFVSAHNSGRNLQTYQQVYNTLNQWLGLIRTRLRFPPRIGRMPLPSPPGSPP